MMTERRYKFSSSRLIGTLGAGAMLIIPLMMGGGGGFVDLPSAMIVLGISFFMLLGTYGSGVLRFIPASLACLVFTPARPVPRYAEMAKFGGRYVIAAGVIGALIGMIQMLKNVTDPSSIGSGMAVALITPLYSLLVSELFFALVYKAHSEPDPAGLEPLPTRGVWIVVAVVGFSLIAFLVVMMALSNMGHSCFPSEAAVERPGILQPPAVEMENGR